MKRSSRNAERGPSLIPIRPNLGPIGRRWTARILVDIGLRRVTRFSKLLRSNPGLSRRLLSKRLRELEGDRVIKRRSKKDGSGAVEWSLTPKGREMLPILMDLMVFGSKWNNPYEFRGALPRPIVSQKAAA